MPEFEAYCESKKICLDEDRIDNERRVTCKFDQQVMDNNVCSFVLDNFVPFTVVETQSFRKIFDGNFDTLFSLLEISSFDFVI